MGSAARADTHYVAPPGVGVNPSNNYTNWNIAATSIFEAVGVTAPGDTVLVSNGTYYLTNQINITNITIKSWRAGALDRDGTVVNGNYPVVTNRCFYVNHANALIEGLTITNGYRRSGSSEDGGGGVFMYAGTLRNCLVTGNWVTNGAGIPGGPGVYAIGVNCMITNCDIIANRGYKTVGGGLTLDSRAQAWNCRIMFNNMEIDNTTGGNMGAGVFMNRGAFYGTLLCNSLIISNAGVSTIGMGAGGGVSMHYGSILRNCLVMGNSVTTPAHASEFGGGVNVYSYSNEVANCTVVGNTSATGSGLFLNSTTTNTTRILNSIIYSNSAGNVYQNSCKGLFVSCCTSSTNGLDGYGNITNLPVLADYASGSYRLASDSPCINRGQNQSWMNGALDLDNHARIDGFSGMVDMGCYEYILQGMIIRIR
jgi:hypothetical protein